MRNDILVTDSISSIITEIRTELITQIKNIKSLTKLLHIKINILKNRNLFYLSMIRQSLNQSITDIIYSLCFSYTIPT